MYSDLPLAIGMGIDGELQSGEKSRHRVTQAWHSRSNPAWRGAIDFGGNGVEPGAAVRFFADVVDDVTPRFHPGRAFDVEVYAVVRSRGKTRLFFDREGRRYSHTEESYFLDVFYTNPVSSEPVKVARLLYEHLDGSKSLHLDEFADGAETRRRRIENGERIGTLAHVRGSRYTSDGWRWTSGTHLHLEVTAAGWASWDRRVHRRSDYTGRFRQWFRSPRDLSLHPDYEERFPRGGDTGYRWWEPALYFNDYHLHDETHYHMDASEPGC